MTPNRDQWDYWNDDGGPRWVGLADRLDAQLGPLGRAGLERADLRPGQRVLDVGCGCGATTLEIASRVGVAGHVLGVDLSGEMLGKARQRAARRAPSRVEFLQADAQVYPFGAGVAERVFSRFGVMFFEDPAAAFANLRAALVAGGRMTFVCWAGPEENPWLELPRRAAARHVELPPVEREAPGPFALASPDRTVAVLERAGFHGVSVESLSGRTAPGGETDLESVVRFCMSIGPAASAVRDAPPRLRAAVADELRRALAPHDSPAGPTLGYRAWIVSARNGAPARAQGSSRA